MNLIDESRAEIIGMERELDFYRNRRDDASKKFASDLMVKRRKLEAKEIILDKI